MPYRVYERGVTSIFIVMFSVLLLITMTVGFMQIMISEQVRTDDSELSQGAYDSALAGVEDGKRVLAACQASGYDSTNPACKAIRDKQCTTVSAAGIVTADSGEVYLKTSVSGSGRDYQQAYTCVKIATETQDYKGSIESGGSLVIPIRAVAPFSKIRLYWRIPNSSRADADTTVTRLQLPALSAWGNGLADPLPALMRSQFMQYQAGSIVPANFDGNDARTVYLYPKKSALGNPSRAVSLNNDARRSGTQQPFPAFCAILTVNDGYHCMTELTDLPGTAASRQSMLRLTSLYGPSDIMIRLYDDMGNIVAFAGVQPSVDSTGRAADVFRRVDARVELVDPNENMLYPRATVDVTKNFCKAFSVSASTADFVDGNITCDSSKP